MTEIVQMDNTLRMVTNFLSETAVTFQRKMPAKSNFVTNVTFTC